MEVTVERDHLASPETLFERLASLAAISKFLGMRGASYQGCQPGPGAVFTVNEVDLFREDRESIEITWTVTAYEPPRRFRAESNDGGVLDFVLTPTDSGTRIALTEMDTPNDADHGFDKFIYKMIQLVPPLARKTAREDAMKNLGRI